MNKTISEVIIEFFARYSIDAHNLTYATTPKGQVETLQARVSPPTPNGMAKAISKEFNKKIVACDYRFIGCRMVIAMSQVLITTQNKIKPVIIRDDQITIAP